MSLTPELRQRLTRLRDLLGTGLVERDVPMRLALLAAMAGEHLLLLGPPGTAKSELARRLRHAIREGRYFERLLTRFSVPEELFGPLSIKALEQDRYERQTAGFVPTAHVVFLDEVFKANSAILNSLLTLLNEREFDNGTTRHATPIVTVIGASNELPEGEELDALYDRFLLRYHVAPVSETGFGELLALGPASGVTTDVTLAFTPSELEEVRRVAQSIDLGDEVREALAALRKYLVEQQIFVSDRRWRKIVGLLRVAALTDGRTKVSIWDAWLLQHCTWEKPEQREVVAAWYGERVGAATPADPVRLLRLVSQHETVLQREREKLEQATGPNGELLYADEAGKPTSEIKGWKHRSRGSDLLYLAPPHWGTDRMNGGKGFTAAELEKNGWRHGAPTDAAYFRNANNWLQEPIERQPIMAPARYSPGHIEHRLRAVREVRTLLAEHLRTLEQNIASATEQIRSHVWLDPAFAEPALSNLRAAQRDARDLDRRLLAVAEGFEALPLLDEPQATAAVS